MTQLALMRELLGAFCGNEMVLGVVLGLWLLLMGIGAWLGRTSDKLRNPLAVLVGDANSGGGSAAGAGVPSAGVAQCGFHPGRRGWCHRNRHQRFPFAAAVLPRGGLCADAGVLDSGARRGRCGHRSRLRGRQHWQHRRRGSVQLRAGRVPRPCRHSGFSRRVEPAGCRSDGSSHRTQIAFGDCRCLWPSR